MPASQSPQSIPKRCTDPLLNLRRGSRGSAGEVFALKPALLVYDALKRRAVAVARQVVDEAADVAVRSVLGRAGRMWRYHDVVLLPQAVVYRQRLDRAGVHVEAGAGDLALLDRPQDRAVV